MMLNDTDYTNTTQTDNSTLPNKDIGDKYSKCGPQKCPEEGVMNTTVISLIAVSGVLFIVSCVAIISACRLYRILRRQKKSTEIDDQQAFIKMDNIEMYRNSLRTNKSISILDENSSKSMSTELPQTDYIMKHEEQERTYIFDIESKSLGLNTIALREHNADQQMRKMQQLFQALGDEQVNSEITLNPSLYNGEVKHDKESWHEVEDARKDENIHKFLTNKRSAGDSDRQPSRSHPPIGAKTSFLASWDINTKKLRSPDTSLNHSVEVDDQLHEFGNSTATSLDLSVEVDETHQERVNSDSTSSNLSVVVDDQHQEGGNSTATSSDNFEVETQQERVHSDYNLSAVVNDQLQEDGNSTATSSNLSVVVDDPMEEEGNRTATLSNHVVVNDEQIEAEVNTSSTSSNLKMANDDQNIDYVETPEIDDANTYL